MEINNQIKKIQDTVLDLLNKAIIEDKLNEKEFDFIVEIIGINPNILKDINFGPEILWELIEKNELLAIEIFFKISQNIIFENYIYCFLKNKFSIKSLYVMFKLILRIDFPSRFLYHYFDHIIDEYKLEINLNNKKRIARFLSCMICNLLENEHITFEAVPPSIKEFFKENFNDSKISELEKMINNSKN